MRRTRSWMPPLAACLALLGPRSGHGVEYTFDGGLALGQQYNSNLLLSSTPEAVWGTNLDLDARLTAGEPNWQVSGRTRLANYFYTPATGIDMQNQSVDGRAFYLTERARYEFTGNVTDDYLLSSQSDPALGLVLGKVHRQSKSFGPSWTYSLSEQAQVMLSYTYTRADYSGPVQNYPNSDTHSAFGQLSYRWSERLSVEGALAYSAYTGTQAAAGYKNSIDTVNATLGVKYAYSPDLDLHGSVGGQYSQSQAEQTFNYLVAGQPPRIVRLPAPVTAKGPARDSVGPIFTLGATRRFENTALDLSYTRQISPSINGDLLEIDSATLVASRQFQTGFSGALSLSYTHQSYPSLNRQSLDFSFYRVEGSLTRAWSEHWTTSLMYRYYLRQAGNGDLPNQDTHSVFLTLKYDFDLHTF